jgi:hypothetical protein
MSDPATPETSVAYTPAPAEPAKWPKVVGIISIVWACLGLMCGLTCGVFGPAFQNMAMASMVEKFGPMPDAMKPAPAQLVLAVVGLIGPVLLLVAGIATARRKPAGRSLHLAYAVVSILLIGAGSVVAMRQQLALVQWAKDHPTDKWVTEGHQGSPIGLVISAAIMVMMFAWPLFCMIWFGAIKRDAKDLDGGTIEPGI